MADRGEFLPLCDVLFNVLSLAAYFCDATFHILVVYTFFRGTSSFGENGAVWGPVSLSFVIASFLLCQFTSLQWYLRKRRLKGKRDAGQDPSQRVAYYSVIGLHLCQCGVLWRYFKLFIPVKLQSIKNDVRDLCMLRMIHGFCESAPMLLILLYGAWSRPVGETVPDLDVISCILSLYNVCWALSSFSKNLLRHNLHKLVLTWLGVVCQFFWRLGTVSSRVSALTLYALLYGPWIFVVFFLHWFTIFLWLMSPRNLFAADALSLTKRAGYCGLVAYVHTICYINLQDDDAQRKMGMFYVIMFLENSLLAVLWLVLRKGSQPWFERNALIAVWGGFAAGMFFMYLYYRFFHIQRLKHTMGLDPDALENGTLTTSSVSSNQSSNLIKDRQQRARHTKKQSASSCVPQVPGVFNCRLNPALGKQRKKKKPSTFVPLPAGNTHPGLVTGTRMLHPFWKRPPASDQDSVSSSRADIQRKLEEKRRKQLQELREIEEEIKQGKLNSRPPSVTSDDSYCPPPRQPIPHSKKQPWLRSQMHCNAHYRSFNRLHHGCAHHNQHHQELILGPGSYYPRHMSASVAPAMPECSGTVGETLVEQLTYRVAQEVLDAMCKQLGLNEPYRSTLPAGRIRRGAAHPTATTSQSGMNPPNRKTPQNVLSVNPLRKTPQLAENVNSSDGDVDSVDEQEGVYGCVGADHPGLGVAYRTRICQTKQGPKPETRL